MVPIFSAPPRVLTGPGCFGEIGREAAAFGARCLVVTGRASMRESGVLARAEALLAEAGVSHTLFEGVEHDPSLETVDRARARCAEAEAELVLGLGGGSALDVAKAAAGLAASDRPTLEFYDGRPMPGGGLPVLAAPSTFGTGSEATRVAVLSDPPRRRKKSIRHDDMLPRVALVDPLLGLCAPPGVSAACGMDALTQAVESLLSRHATDLTRALSREAARLLFHALPRAVENGEDVGARHRCANGSLLAGIALHNARLGIVHGAAHPLGARYGLAHGEVCGLLLPHALRFNREAAGEGYEELSELFGEDAAEACAHLLHVLGLPTDLSHLGMTEEEREAVAAQMLESGSTKANPRPVDREAALAFLRAASG